MIHFSPIHEFQGFPATTLPGQATLLRAQGNEETASGPIGVASWVPRGKPGSWTAWVLAPVLRGHRQASFLLCLHVPHLSNGVASTA